MLAAAAAFTIASSVAERAQIVYPFPSYRYPNAYPDASVHFDVTPQDADVYVDGYYAGIVDDFDGMFQRLRVEPGQHEITIYRDGYRAIHQRVYLARDRTFTIKHADGHASRRRSGRAAANPGAAAGRLQAAAAVAP